MGMYLTVSQPDFPVSGCRRVAARLTFTCPSRSSENAAVARCIRAWHRAQKKESANGSSDYKSQCAGNIAYLRAVPPLSGHQNVRDFIACVIFAALTEV